MALLITQSLVSETPIDTVGLARWEALSEREGMDDNHQGEAAEAILIRHSAWEEEEELPCRDTCRSCACLSATLTLEGFLFYAEIRGLSPVSALGWYFPGGQGWAGDGCSISLASLLCNSNLPSLWEGHGAKPTLVEKSPGAPVDLVNKPLYILYRGKQHLQSSG